MTEFHPINVFMFNADFGHGRRGGENAAKVAMHLAAIVAGVECKMFDAHSVFDEDRWVVFHDTSQSDLAGNMLALRKDRVRVLDHRWELGVSGVRSEPGLPGMEARHILWADLEIDGAYRVRVIVVHFPPKRFWDHWPAMVTAVNRVAAASPYPVLVASDFNKLARAVGPALHLPTSMVGIVGWAHAAEIAVSDTRTVNVGSDHPGIQLQVTGVTTHEEGGQMHGFMPGAIVHNIPPGSNDPGIVPCGVIAHVAVSLASSLGDFFEHDGGIESHFYIRFDGSFEQYRSIFFEADAQGDGNSFTLGGRRVGFVSVETEGMGDGEWTPEQLATFKCIVLWVKSQSDFPLEVCPEWNSPGVGYHALHPRWNKNAHSCPGPKRIAQFNQTIVPWLHGNPRPTPDPTKEDDVSWTDDIEAWQPGDKDPKDTMKAGQQLNQARGYAKATYALVRKLLDVDKFADAVAAKVNANVTADAEVVKQAVKDALSEGVDG